MSHRIITPEMLWGGEQPTELRKNALQQIRPRGSQFPRSVLLPWNFGVARPE